jgi:glutaredoxin 2
MPYSIPVPSSLSPFFSSTPLNNASPLLKTVSWILDPVDRFLQDVEQSLSDWFSNFIADLPKSYFANDFTTVNYRSKLFWEGVFNERIEALKEEIQAGELSEEALTTSLEGLQDLVGQYSLSPQVYEEGLEELKKTVRVSSQRASHYRLPIEQVKTNWRSTLKIQPSFLEECLRGDILQAIRQASGQSITEKTLNLSFDYYERLLSPSRYLVCLRQLKSDLTTGSNPSYFEDKRVKSPSQGERSISSASSASLYSRLVNPLRALSKFIVAHPAQAITLGLATQTLSVVGQNVTVIDKQNSTEVDLNRYMKRIPLPERLAMHEKAFEFSTKLSEPFNLTVQEARLFRIVFKSNGLSSVNNMQNITAEDKLVYGLGSANNRYTLGIIGLIADKLDAKIMKLEQRVEEAEVREELNSLQDEVAWLTNSVIEFKESSSSNNTINTTDIITDLDTKINDLTERLNNIKVDISGKYSRETDAINIKIQALKKDLTQLNKTINELEGLNGGVKNNTQQIEKNTQQIEKQQEINKNRAIAECINAIKKSGESGMNDAKIQWTYIIELNGNNSWREKDIQRIVQGLYDTQLNKFDFDKVDDFIRNILLNNIEQAAVAYETLMDELKGKGQFYTQEIAKLGYRIKEKMDSPNYSNIGQEYKTKYESLKSQLPEAIKGLYFGLYFNPHILFENKVENCVLNAGYPHCKKSWNRGYQDYSYIEWRPIAKNRGEYFVFFNRVQQEGYNGSYLDAGPDHYRYRRAGEEDTNLYLRWEVRPKEDDVVVLYNKKVSGYLDSGPKHMCSSKNEEACQNNENTNSYLRWKITGLVRDFIQ